VLFFEGFVMSFTPALCRKMREKRRNGRSQKEKIRDDSRVIVFQEKKRLKYYILQGLRSNTNKNYYLRFALIAIKIEMVFRLRKLTFLQGFLSNASHIAPPNYFHSSYTRKKITPQININHLDYERLLFSSKTLFFLLSR
jgi:hypothetical protein